MRLVVNKEDKKTVSIDNIDKDKIYAFVGVSNVYKLHRVNTEERSERYAFISLSDSMFFANGVFETMKDAIGDCISGGDKVYEFDNPADFCQWALNKYEELKFDL